LRLVAESLTNLSDEERESHVLNWWGIDEEDDEYFLLSLELQLEIKNNEDPPADIRDKKYDELIVIAMSAEFVGVTNEYIEESLKGFGRFKVDGDVEKLEMCPCCEYRTIESRGEYYVCPLCGWEDGGSSKLDEYSSPNHQTMRDAREKFQLNLDPSLLRKWVKA